LSDNKAKTYGKLLKPYLEDEETFIVVSSDFCHWGKRFSYTFYDKQLGEIHQSIEALDRMGMDMIESLDPSKFTEYLKKYKNTICGRFPILVLLYAVEASDKNYSIKFIAYAQSSACKNMSDSSVSYASAILTISQ
jgi:AmmeMemoRadiSam system protein B